MTDTSTPNLGTIIPNDTARKVVYGAYTIAAIVVGALAAYFLGIGQQLPEIVVGAQAVVAYLGIPVGGLALANTTTS